jgi:tRNA(Ile)-lysidine synthase
VAAHVHHHLRASADEDAAFVEALCARLDVPCHVEDVRPGERAGNVEATAREMRYDALLRVAGRTGAVDIAAAHHGEDQLETMLMALCRGAGLEGLGGMSWRRPLGGGVMLLRPMLAMRRADCESLCRAAGIEWREDPMNADASMARARLRRDVLPVLETLWPGAAKRATGTADVIDAARRVIDERIASVFGEASNRAWRREDLAALPEAIIAAGLRRAALDEMMNVADDLGQRQLLEAASTMRDDERRPREFHWPGGMVLRVTSREVTLSRCNV